jgi:hypothetical protein
VNLKDELKNLKKQSEMSRIQQNTTSLDQRFADDMVKHGFLDKDGNGDMDVVDLISEAVLSKLSKKVTQDLHRLKITIRLLNRF